MIKKNYTDKFYSYNSKYISNILSLRPPQHESLEIFAKLCDILSLRKKPENADENFYNEDLRAVREFCPTLTSFERDFPSVCFSLATGIGKTRLMGACIAYLHYEKGYNNFFVMAPNLTIYKKLKNDLGDTGSSKYVFRGLDKFVNPPRIIDGDNYAEFNQTKLGNSDVVVNVFNISKLNSESKGSNGSSARIKRLNEVLGESYFSYLQSLPDLCIFMDESHHYHADRSFDVINELHPILGAEFTATPQIQKGTKKIAFRNVVYEYSLAHALDDGLYVKVPAVFTRKNFRPEEYTPQQLDREKLNDGIRLHEETKSKLEIYARTFNKPIVNPFMLVVAKNTEHSKEIMDYIKSSDFFDGYYKDKVIEINSAQRGAEKDENIERLLSLEKPDNKTEIVIHVNMLKEGWDVTNLYTIVPLRASASETLTEQTIGRGLRLPYGMRTGDDAVDRLSIVSHDKYEAIINLANDPNSLVRKVYYIEPMGKSESECIKQETIEMPSVYDSITHDTNFAEQLTWALHESMISDSEPEEKISIEQTREVAKFVASYTSRSVIDLNKQIKTFDALKDEQTMDFVKNTIIRETRKQFSNMNLTADKLNSVINSALETCVQALTNNIIPIPQRVIQPSTTVKQGFYNFKLDTERMNWHPSDDTLIGTELQQGGETFSVHTGRKAVSMRDTVENEIVRHIIIHDNVDYRICAELIYSLINDAKQHFLTYLSEEETEKVMRDRQKTIAEIIYGQMNQHFYLEKTEYKATCMRPFSHIESGFGSRINTDDIYDFRASVPAKEVPSKIFKGFNKACHTLYKFDNDTERKFAIILENDDEVLKWMRPSAKQFNIYYGSAATKRYEPDFIVETEKKIYMVETKAKKDIYDEDVKEKARAAMVYCNSVTDWNKDNGGKPCQYVLISHDEVKLNSGFTYLVNNRVLCEQLNLEM